MPKVLLNLERASLKIHAQSVTHDGHLQIIHRAGQLPNLIGGQKLRLINKTQAQGPALGALVFWKTGLFWMQGVASAPIPMRDPILPVPARSSKFAVNR